MKEDLHSVMLYSDPLLCWEMYAVAVLSPKVDRCMIFVIAIQMRYWNVVEVGTVLVPT